MFFFLRKRVKIGFFDNFDSWYQIKVYVAMKKYRWNAISPLSYKDVGPNNKLNYFTNTLMILYHVDKYQTGTLLIYLHINHILEMQNIGKQKLIKFKLYESMKQSMIRFVHVVN